jgi:hypothetical protein
MPRRKNILAAIDQGLRQRVEHLDIPTLKRLALMLRYRRSSSRLLVRSLLRGHRHPALLLPGGEPRFSRAKDDFGSKLVERKGAIPGDINLSAGDLSAGGSCN